MKQAEIEQLLEACGTATDPLKIVNAFFRCPPGVELPDSYWEKRFCIVAEELAQRNRERAKHD